MTARFVVLLFWMLVINSLTYAAQNKPQVDAAPTTTSDVEALKEFRSFVVIVRDLAMAPAAPTDSSIIMLMPAHTINCTTRDALGTTLCERRANHLRAGSAISDIHFQSASFQSKPSAPNTSLTATFDYTKACLILKDVSAILGRPLSESVVIGHGVGDAGEFVPGLVHRFSAQYPSEGGHKRLVTLTTQDGCVANIDLTRIAN